LIRENSSAREEDEARFVDALIFNWLICGTDAHAKNYSFLIAPPGQVRLSPFYDLSSALPYGRQIAPRDATLAMKIGGKYKVLTIGARELEKFAAELRIDFDPLRSRILRKAGTLPDAARQVATEIKAQGITHDVIGRLSEALAARAVECESGLRI
jgi:serine/threonine-protein kinase HipA